jgi:outer membrane protein TolC
MALPLFDQNHARIAKAQYLYWQEIKRYEAEYLQAIQEIRIAVDQAQTALVNTAYYQQEVVPQAERNLEFSRVSYLAGQTSILTLLEAQWFLLESRRGDIAVRLELATAISELEQRVGEQMGNDSGATGLTSKPEDNMLPATAVEK